MWKTKCQFATKGITDEAFSQDLVMGGDFFAEVKQELAVLNER